MRAGTLVLLQNDEELSVFNTEYVSYGHVINDLHYVEVVSPYSVCSGVHYHESLLNIPLEAVFWYQLR